MIEEKATVVRVADNEILVAAARNSACGQCGAKDDCGQSAIAQWAASKMVDVAVVNPQHFTLNEGDVVLLGIDEHSFIKASVMLYLLPLIAMFVGGLVAEVLQAQQWLVILSAVTGLLISFFGIKIYTKRMADDSSYQPVVLSVIG